MNKYHAKKTNYKGIIYDSKWEANRAYELEILEKTGRISDLQRQVKFVLLEGYINNRGNKIRPIYYIADFVYKIKAGVTVVEDTKSPATKTEVYKLKKKLFEYKYPDILFVERIKK